MAAQRNHKCTQFGIILGSVGRQGSPNILRYLQEVMDKAGIEYIVVLLSEIFPEKLKLFKDIDAWVQVACPRLSINWSSAFDNPLLQTQHEASVALKVATLEDDNPIDFYAQTLHGL